MTPRIAEIQAVVAEHFGLSIIEMRGNRQGRAISRPRQIAMALAVEMTHCSLPAIGRQFGGKDHSTVFHARKAVSRRNATDLAHQLTYAALRDRCLPQSTEALCCAMGEMA